MPESDEIATVRRYAQAWATADLDLFEEVLAPDFAHYILGRREDRAGLLTRVEAGSGVLTDVEMTIDGLFQDGPYVTCIYTMSGRHTGPLPLSGPLAQLLGRDVLSPTGQAVTRTGMFTAKVENGQLVDGWGEYDRLGLLLEVATAEVTLPATDS